jgi:catechol 2,3-dioxygenase-like lactoylglutathione lyase family enzyme
MRTYLDAKAMAKSLRAALAAKNIALSHSESLELVAKQFGFGEWNMLSAKIDLETGVRRPPPESPGISLQPPVPVVGISSPDRAKRFYVDFLGFVIDWGWREGDDQPMYAQISRSGVSMHLSEHHAPGTELLIRMTGLDALHAELASATHGYALAVRHTPDDRREVHVTDPFGNKLRFSENNPPHVSKA